MSHSPQPVAAAAVKDVPSDCVEAARRLMEAEARAIHEASARLGPSFRRAVDTLANQRGKVIVSGLGKSGNVAQKLAATLSSTGTCAVFMHPTEALHGDLGMYSPGDPTILISKSGATEEMLKLVPLLRRLESPVIGILGNIASPLARQSDMVLDASVRREADPENIAPTSSSAVAMAIGDALALAVMAASGYSSADFQRRHPAGHLGETVSLTVRDVMHSGDEVAWVAPSQPLKQTVIAMSGHPLGAACVVGPDGGLQGLITDGDLRRALENCDDIRALSSGAVMTSNPVTVSPDAPLRTALALMEDRPSQISVLPVIEETGSCVGLIRLHDIYLAGKLIAGR